MNFKNILAIGAHPDDIEISCLGTLLKLHNDGSKINTIICSYGSMNDPSSTKERISESRESLSCIENLNFDYFDQKGIDLTSYELLSEKIRQKIISIKPNLIFVHDKNDTHQEHRLVNEIVLTASRRINTSILQFNSPSSSLNFKPDIFIDITDFVDIKHKALRSHKSQLHHDYFTEDYINQFHKNYFAKMHSINAVEQFRIERILL